jgi:peptide/nickel transport system substrate-binding protein
VNGDSAVIAYNAEPDTLNPLTTSSANGKTFLYGSNWSQVFETLLQYDPDNRWKVTKPLLAEGYPEISPDHLTYIFTVRDGVKWHDGTPFTAEDVLFSAKATFCPGIDDAAVRSNTGDLVNVEIVDPRKIRFTMRKPYFLDATQLGLMYIVAKHVFDPQGVLDKYTFPELVSAKANSNAVLKKFAEEFNKSPNARTPIGTGPYKFEKWDSGRELSLVRNDGYWGKKPYLNRLTFRVIPDYTTALTALKAGDIDLQPRLLPVQYTQQTSGPGFDERFAKSKYPLLGYYYIGWNEEKPFFKDKRVRQALTMLLDRANIVNGVRFGLATVAVGPFHPSSADYDSNIQPWPYDAVRALQLLDEAGWTDHDGDGIRDKDGVPFRFEFLGQAQNNFFDQLAPIVKESLRKAGIEVQEKRLEFNVVVSNLKDHNFDAAVSAWTSDLETDPFQLWHSTQAKDHGSNFVCYQSPDVDKILEDARLEFDAQKRKQLYWRFQEIIHQDQPYTFLFYPEESAAYSKRFQNVAFIPPRPNYDLNSWFVPEVDQKYTHFTASRR